MVEGTLDAVSLPALSADFYRRAFDTDPELARMFTADRRVQEARFATELAAIVRSIRCHDEFVPAGRALGPVPRLRRDGRPLPRDGRRPAGIAGRCPRSDVEARGGRGMAPRLQPDRRDDAERRPRAGQLGVTSGRS